MAKKMPIGLFVAELEAALKRKDGYIMGATGQNPTKWAITDWWFTQYSGAQKEKALYWREHAERVWDCNGLAEGIYKDYTGTDINTQAKNNYASWCDPKGTGLIPAAKRVAGAAVFWGDSASSIHHVAYLDRPVDPAKPTGDWYLIEARGVAYGVVQTKLKSRKPNFWGYMTKYFDYDSSVKKYELGERELKSGMSGDDVAELQKKLLSLGFDCGPDGADGDFGPNTEEAVYNFQYHSGLPNTGIADQATIAALISGNAVSNDNQITIVNCKSCNLRLGPGTNFPIRTTAAPGCKFTKVDTTGWTLALTPEGELLWVSDKYVQIGGGKT